MTEAATTEERTPPKFELNIELRFPEDGEVELRPIALGLSPLILIEPQEEGDVFRIDVDSTGFDLDELGDLLDILREGITRAQQEQS